MRSNENEFEKKGGEELDYTQSNTIDFSNLSQADFLRNYEQLFSVYREFSGLVNQDLKIETQKDTLLESLLSPALVAMVPKFEYMLKGSLIDENRDLSKMSEVFNSLQNLDPRILESLLNRQFMQEETTLNQSFNIGTPNQIEDYQGALNDFSIAYHKSAPLIRMNQNPTYSLLLSKMRSLIDTSKVDHEFINQSKASLFRSLLNPDLSLEERYQTLKCLADTNDKALGPIALYRLTKTDVDVAKFAMEGLIRLYPASATPIIYKVATESDIPATKARALTYLMDLDQNKFNLAVSNIQDNGTIPPIERHIELLIKRGPLTERNVKNNIWQDLKLNFGTTDLSELLTELENVNNFIDNDFSDIGKLGDYLRDPRTRALGLGLSATGYFELKDEDTRNRVLENLQNYDASFARIVQETKENEEVVESALLLNC